MLFIIKTWSSKNPITRVGIKWVIILLVGALLYFANKQLQSYWGEQARQETGLVSVELSKAIKLAQQEHKLVLAEMSAVWCPTCRKLEQKIFSNAVVKKQIMQHYIFTRIDYDSIQAQQFMSQYKVKGFPTVLVLNGAAEQVANIPLTFNSTEYSAMLKKVSLVVKY
ncbi:MAG: thioredoxin family protein [Alteromonadaceae bacterium]|nr:thioredoxin family protein [Alteromonadaceae bacterium]